MPKDGSIASVFASAPLLGRTLEALARGTPDSLNAHLQAVEIDVPLNGTKAKFHCHFVASDARGRPRVAELIERICFHVLDYAIPRSKIQVAREHFDATGSTYKIIQLRDEAVALFTDLTQTGEGGELLLFVMAETVLRLPQIISKMSLKTSTRMHYHGADGVHAGVCPNTGLLSLYWCESKINADVKSAISNCFKSLAPYLIEEDGPGATRRRDIMLLGGHADLADAQLDSAIRAYLDKDNPASNQLKYCGIGLVGFDGGCYPTEATTGQIAETIKSFLIDWREHAGRRIIAEHLDSFDVHLLCVPLPSADNFRDMFLRQLGLKRDGAG